MSDDISKPIDTLHLQHVLGRAPSSATPSRATMPPAADIFNEAALVEQTGGDVEFMREIIELFVRSTSTLLAQIAAALGGTDTAAVRVLAHTIKGSAATVSAVAIAECARALERMPVETLTRNSDAPLAASFAETVEVWRHRGWLARNDGAEPAAVG
jgi:HPt (histidine-containing phosphotransfer) domain-containing protein